MKEDQPPNKKRSIVRFQNIVKLFAGFHVPVPEIFGAICFDGGFAHNDQYFVKQENTTRYSMHKKTGIAQRKVFQNTAAMPAGNINNVYSGIPSLRHTSA
jgi:hypothetical protein